MIDDKTTIIWQLAASGYTSTLITKMTAPSNRIPGSTSILKDAFAHWMQIDIAWNDSFKKVYPLQSFYAYLEHIEGYAYNTSRLLAASEPPVSAAVSGSAITCNEDTTEAARYAVLYSWNFVNFIETEIEGVLDSGVWTFSAVPSGTYVVAFDGSLPTMFLTVS